MKRFRALHIPFATLFLIGACNLPGAAQDDSGPSMNMNMHGMENSVGFIASGTSMEPESTFESSNMMHGSLGKWTAMFHADLKISDIQQTGPRGADRLFSTNWIMPMVSRQFGRQSVSFTTMLSLEPATVTHRRFPQLFQTGETAFGLPIVDGQHPHNFFMELAGRYEINLSPDRMIFFYGGPIGEPALGPTAFPHRASASENPLAMLGHHEQDSTHVSASVITAGISAGSVQLEASTFHGREPNENRWNIVRGKPDSFSGRMTVSVGRSLSAQISSGMIHDREALDPGANTLRTTASVHHSWILPNGSLSSSLIWGRNRDRHDGEQRIFNAYALESTLNFRSRNWVWTRIENLDKDRTLLFGETRAALTVEETSIGRVQSYGFGYERDIVRNGHWVNLGLGFQFNAFGLTNQMKKVYGNSPTSYTLFLHLRPVGNMASMMRAMRAAGQH